ncbi:MAG: EAL domain-containing protein [Eubacteriales bacterium]|nr:EAL domain-containing protein [Eubacteriales bacterium]
MKKFIWYMLQIALVAAAVVLVIASPDMLSRVITVLMALLLLFTLIFGLTPLTHFYEAFTTGLNNVRDAYDQNPEMAWSNISDREKFFGHKEMDQMFDDYKTKVQQQRKSGVNIGSIGDIFTDEMIALKSWQGVLNQIPGTMTGLGILGTFIGLIVGIRALHFDTIDAAIASIETLLAGINTAFYTSIAGVILSIAFNIVYRMLWNVCLREHDLFVDEFQRYIIPPESEQQSFRDKVGQQEILERLDRLPKKGEYSLANGGTGRGTSNSNESVLLPQIISGLKNNEFIFHLQPRYDINTRKIIGAEALVRWNHPKLGLVMPSVFMPVIENNGYITKLDCYIWESAFKTLRRWIDSGMKIVPITLNISKTDILAMDIAQFFSDMLQKYRIPPRYIDLDIAENAYMQANASVLEAETILRQHGFRVVIDGFNGDFVQLSSIGTFNADMLKLDLRFISGSISSVNTILSQAMQLKMNIAAEGIENMEQMSALRKGGCTEGQGYYLSKPVSMDNFEDLINKEN